MRFPVRVIALGAFSGVVGDDDGLRVITSVLRGFSVVSFMVCCYSLEGLQGFPLVRCCMAGL
jgi:hypothetical protein